MTHGQSVSSCFYKGKKANKPQIRSHSLIKRGFTCKEKHPTIIKNPTRFFQCTVTELQLLKNHPYF